MSQADLARVDLAWAGRAQAPQVDRACPAPLARGAPRRSGTGRDDRRLSAAPAEPAEHQSQQQHQQHQQKCSAPDAHHRIGVLLPKGFEFADHSAPTGRSRAVATAAIFFRTKSSAGSSPGRVNLPIAPSPQVSAATDGRDVSRRHERSMPHSGQECHPAQRGDDCPCIYRGGVRWLLPSLSVFCYGKGYESIALLDISIAAGGCRDFGGRGRCGRLRGGRKSGARRGRDGPAAGFPEQIDKLIAQLGDKDYYVRQRAQEELARLGFEAFDALSAATTDDDLEIASRAKYLLRLMRVEWTAEERSAGGQEVSARLRDRGCRRSRRGEDAGCWPVCPTARASPRCAGWCGSRSRRCSRRRRRVALLQQQDGRDAAPAPP